MNGNRHGAARYPNADPETQFWPIGYLTSKEDFLPKGDWKNPTIEPKPNPATIVEVSSEGRRERARARACVRVCVRVACNGGCVARTLSAISSAGHPNIYYLVWLVRACVRAFLRACPQMECV